MIAIDLGSNSLRMIQMDCETGCFTQEYDKIVKTAELLHSEGIIAEASIQRIMDGFDEASSLFDFKTEKWVAVTTEAMRRATNAEYAIEKIYKHTGVRFEVIGAHKEAALTLLAVERRLDSLGFRGSFVLIDIGGASTEVIFKKGNLSESKSFPIGIVTMASKYPSREEMDANLVKELSEVKAYLKEYQAREGKSDFFVATAGTPTTIAAFKQGMTYDTYDTARINGSTLNYFDCTRILDELLALSVEERTRHVGVGREELIIAGVMIYATFFKLFDYENSVIIDDGLREGLAISACEQDR
jgi:exopolyphosphatase/guanosine-5'-triphosphate,3'-diphosphate pyrophosphatase